MYNAKKMKKLSDEISNIGVLTTRDNANVGNNFSAKLLQIASVSNKTVVGFNLADDERVAHEEGAIHIHDEDSYNLTVNCLQIPTGEVLDRGFNTGYGTINKPKRIDSAASLSCIILQSSQNDMFGGQSHYDFDNDMGKYVQATREEILDNEMNSALEYGTKLNINKYSSTNIKLKSKESGEETIDIENFSLSDQLKIAQRVKYKLQKAVDQAMQIVMYNLNSMHARAGQVGLGL